MFSEKGLQVFFSILEVIEIYTTQLEMGKAHILNSATALSSVIGTGDLLHSTTVGAGRKYGGMDG